MQYPRIVPLSVDPVKSQKFCGKNTSLRTPHRSILQISDCFVVYNVTVKSQGEVALLQKTKQKTFASLNTDRRSLQVVSINIEQHYNWRCSQICGKSHSDYFR